MNNPDSPFFLYKVESNRLLVTDCSQKKRRRRFVDLSNTKRTNKRAKAIKSIYLKTTKVFYFYSLLRRTIALKITYLLSEKTLKGGCFLGETIITSINNSFAGEELFLVLDNNFVNDNIDFIKEFFLILIDYFLFVYFSYFLIRFKAKRFFMFV